MHIFVRDFIIPARVGIREGERAAPQRVRFDLEVTLGSGHDSRNDYLSYDDITGAIGAVVDEGHIDLVETLAWRIAERILRDERAGTVKIRIEKPDITPGIRGVEAV
jgi:dihydroneopterin aldolase